MKNTNCSTVPSGLVGLPAGPGIETPGYFRDILSGLGQARRITTTVLQRILATMICVAVAVSAGKAQTNGDSTPPAKHSDWNGFDRLDFVVDGRDCLLVVPKTSAPGKPWIWRTEFFGHEPQGDLALLTNGYHVAYMDVQNMYGAPVALDHMDKFYAHLTARYGLGAKTVLEGFSRGGLFAFNWAARHPDEVACLYVDAPVCDFKSWPGGLGKGPGSADDWTRCKSVYGLTDEQARAYQLNPVDNLAPLAKAKIPILGVIGDADEVVPIAENTLLVKERYQKLGGEIEVISKPGVGHHPHSLKDPAPIVAFILRHAPSSALVELIPANVHRVVFLGDSITYSGQYVNYIEAYFKSRHPERKIEFLNLGLPSETASGLSEPEHMQNGFPRPDLHERLARVLAQTKPDLVFACYGMNDGIYLPFGEQRFKAFQDGIIWLHDEVVKSGAKIIHITPPTFDEVKGGHPSYSATLDRYSAWLLTKRATDWDVIDIHEPMNRVLAERRAKDPTFAFAGDGVHAGDYGHWIIARQILLGLGATDVADAEDVHPVLAAAPHGEELLKLIGQRQGILKDAWLTTTGHKRPGMAHGLPLAEAQAAAAKIDNQVQGLTR